MSRCLCCTRSLWSRLLKVCFSCAEIGGKHSHSVHFVKHARLHPRLTQLRTLRKVRMSVSTLDPALPYEKPWYEKALILAVVIIPLAATLYAIVTLWERYVTPLDLALLVV